MWTSLRIGLFLNLFIAVNKTRKSYVTARSVAPTCCVVSREGTLYPAPGRREGVGTPLVLVLAVRYPCPRTWLKYPSLSSPSPPIPVPWRGHPSPHLDKTRTGVTPCSYQSLRERTTPGKGPGTTAHGYYSLPLWIDKQTENLTFPRAFPAGIEVLHFLIFSAFRPKVE